MERAAVVTASKLNRDPSFYSMLIEGNWKESFSCHVKNLYQHAGIDIMKLLSWYCVSDSISRRLNGMCSSHSLLTVSVKRLN